MLCAAAVVFAVVRLHGAASRGAASRFCVCLHEAVAGETILSMLRGATALAVLVVAVIAGAIVLTGSGLSVDERRDVATAEAAIAPTGVDGRSARARAAVDRLIEIFRAEPDAEYDGRTMGEVLADAARDLRPYRPWLADRLQRESNRLLSERDRGKGPVDVGLP